MSIVPLGFSGDGSGLVVTFGFHGSSGPVTPTAYPDPFAATSTPVGPDPFAATSRLLGS